MNLYTLNLHRPISVPANQAEAWASILRRASRASEGFEALASWNPETLIHVGDDGPTCPDIPSIPLACGATAADESLTGSPGSCTLPEGRYMFCQAVLQDETSLAECIEWFARECWWQNAATEGRIWLRLLREDGKTAIQVLQACKSGSQ